MNKKDILLFSALLFVFVAIWGGYNIYRSAVNSTISEETNQDISPINPTFDTKTIDLLKGRQEVNPSFDNIEVVTPTTPPASSSAKLSVTPTQVASKEGEISQ